MTAVPMTAVSRRDDIVMLPARVLLLRPPEPSDSERHPPVSAINDGSDGLAADACARIDVHHTTREWAGQIANRVHLAGRSEKNRYRMRRLGREPNGRLSSPCRQSSKLGTLFLELR